MPTEELRFSAREFAMTLRVTDPAQRLCIDSVRAKRAASVTAALRKHVFDGPLTAEDAQSVEDEFATMLRGAR